MNSKKNYNFLNCLKLTNVDVIQKYCLRSFYELPTVEKVIFSSSLTNIKINNKSINQSIVNQFFFLAFYLFFNVSPTIKVFHNKTKSFIDMSDKEKLIIKSTIINKAFINHFKRFFFSQIEVLSYLKQDLNKIELKINNDQIKAYLNVPIHGLLDFNYLLNEVTTRINNREDCISICFIIKSKNCKRFLTDKAKNFLQNFLFFWLI